MLQKVRRRLDEIRRRFERTLENVREGHGEGWRRLEKVGEGWRKLEDGGWRRSEQVRGTVGICRNVAGGGFLLVFQRPACQKGS